MQRLVLLLVFSVLAFAQAPEPQPELSGIVVDTKGEPVRKADIILTPIRPDRPGEFQQSLGNFTGEDGTFEFYGVPTGSYRLAARKAGFLDGLYGATNEASSGVALLVREGQALPGVRLELTPHAVVSGRVAASDGGAPGNTAVRLLRVGYEDGRPTLLYVSSTRTTRAGDFRLAGVAAGRYYLRAEVNQPAPSGPGVDPEAPTYFPGAVRFEDAEPIDVGTGQTVEGLFLPMRRSAAYSVSGVVRGPDTAGVNVSLRGDSTVLGASLSGGSARTKPDGSFEISPVLPGTYRLIAAKNDPEAPLAGQLSLAVNSDINNADVELRPPFQVSGTVVSDDGLPLSQQVFVSLLRPSGLAAYGAQRPSQGEFAFGAVLADTYQLQVRGIPTGVYIRAATLGGSNALAGPVPLTESTTFRVELGLATGQIVGFTENVEGEPTEAVLTLIPDPPQPLRSERYLVTDALGNGAFRFLGVPPGKYLLYAWENLDRDVFFDAEFTARYREAAASIEITDGEIVQSSVVRIPAEQAR